MPAIVVASLITAGAAAGTAVYATQSQKGAAKKARNAQISAEDKRIAFERELEERRRREFDEIQAAKQRQFDAEQAELARQSAEEQRRYDYGVTRERELDEREQTRLRPYHAAGAAAVEKLAGMPMESGGVDQRIAAAAKGAQPPRASLLDDPRLMPPQYRDPLMSEVAGLAKDPSALNVTFRLEDLDPRWRGVRA